MRRPRALCAGRRPPSRRRGPARGPGAWWSLALADHTLPSRRFSRDDVPRPDLILLAYARLGRFDPGGRPGASGAREAGPELAGVADGGHPGPPSSCPALWPPP